MTEEPRTAGDAARFLERRKQQLEQAAGEFPREAFEQALREAHEQLGTVIQERDHFRSEMWRLGRLLAVVVHDNDDELDINISEQEELGNLMLDFTLDEATQIVTVRLEPAPPPSAEANEKGAE